MRIRPESRRALAALLAVPLVAGGCRWGPRVERFPAATSPVGAAVVVDAPPAAPFQGELLATADSGLFVVRAARVTFVPYGGMRRAQVVGLGADHVLVGGAEPERLARLRLVSRFPQGLDGDLLARVLRVHGQPAVDRLAAPVADDSAHAAFVGRAIEGTRAFRDRRAAIAAGYRLLGMDFPAMGEHWVNPGLVIAGRFDPARPAMLSYVRVRGEPTLVGVVYAVPLDSGARPPAIPGDARLWHEHNGTIDEESLVATHDAEHADGHASAHGPHDASDAGAASGRPTARLAILHAWTAVPNPAGLFAADNWALPFARLGLAVPAPVDPLAARALSLVDGGEEYWVALVANGAPLAPAAESAVRDALGEARATARDVVARERADAALTAAALTAAELDALRAAWERLAERVEAVAGRAAGARLRGAS